MRKCLLFIFLLSIAFSALSQVYKTPRLQGGIHYQNALCFDKPKNLFKKGQRKNGTIITSYNSFGPAVILGNPNNNNLVIAGFCDFAIININGNKKNSKALNIGSALTYRVSKNWIIGANLSHFTPDNFGKQSIDPNNIFEYSGTISFRPQRLDANHQIESNTSGGFRVGKIGQEFFIGLNYSASIFSF